MEKQYWGWAGEKERIEELRILMKYFFLEMDSRKQQHPRVWLRWQDGNKGEINVAAIIKDLRMEGRGHIIRRVQRTQ